MSRVTRTNLPVSKHLLKPKPLNSGTVHNHLSKKRENQKKFYNRGSQPLTPLHNSQVVRLQTEKGHDKIGIVKMAAAEPRSYLVELEGREYRRNRRHLLLVAEQHPQASADPASENENIWSPPGVPMSPEIQPPTHNEHSPGHSGETPIQTLTECSTPRSRYGRPLKPNPKYNT
ncbi:hypothetical protein N1851_002056 [Merluccius polli]|uniref:Uncharacterized protein n=1 Tax=Merluccius polli TaxID=89951 RepID=A0AA47NCD3_MERPO|nr:hypothetical protein N1851_002056 [Merluccius polli]